MKSNIILVCWIAAYNVCSNGLKSSRFKMFYQDDRRLQHKYTAQSNVTILECARLCHRDARCMAVNFRENGSTNNCELNDKNTNATGSLLEEHNGWEIYNKVDGSDVYKGCYKDDEDDREFPVKKVLTNTNTPELCVSYCRSYGYQYAALQYGTECYCGQSYGRHGSYPESECYMNCPGDPSRTCGGGWANRVYSTNVNSPSVYKGCYRDDEFDREYSFKHVYYNENTPETCVFLCIINGHSYAALQYQTECFCGPSYGRHGELPESECSMACSGDAGQTCGGGFANKVYSTGL